MLRCGAGLFTAIFYTIAAGLITHRICKPLQTRRVIVVGYLTAENTVAGGNRMMGSMFSDVGKQLDGTSTFSVQGIVPVGEAVPNGEIVSTTECITLRKLTATGGTDGDVLYWRDGSFKAGKKTVNFHGWYTAGGTTAADMTLAAGQAVWIYFPAAANCTLQMSGEVALGEVYMALNQGNTAVANPLPLTCSVQKTAPFGKDSTVVPNGETVSTTACITLRKLTAAGGTDGDVLYWRDGSFKAGKKTVNFHGWYTAGGTTQADMTLAPGEGLWMFCPVENIAIVFPSAFAPAE